MTTKLNKFKILHGKLNEALEYGFYIEALVIEYAIIDNRLRRIAELLNIKYSRNDFKTRFKEMKKALQIADKTLTNELIANHAIIVEFIHDRNLIIHGLVDFEYDLVYVEKTALNGLKVVDYFQALSQKVKK